MEVEKRGLQRRGAFGGGLTGGGRISLRGHSREQNERTTPVKNLIEKGCSVVDEVIKRGKREKPLGVRTSRALARSGQSAYRTKRLDYKKAPTMTQRALIGGRSIKERFEGTVRVKVEKERSSR